MYAYPKDYLNDVVETQGKLFDFVAQTFPDKDTEEFITAYMKSKTRKSIDEAQAYVNTMDTMDLWAYFLETDQYTLKNGNGLSGFMPDWIGEFYAYYQWYYNIPSSELVVKIPVDFLKKAYYGLHDLQLDLAVKILETSDVAYIKQLGRTIKNYNENAWNGVRQIIVYEGLTAKFSQNQFLKEQLLNTKECLLAECAVKDKIWGIGLSMTDTNRLDQSKWSGQNLLGYTLMMVRKQLKMELILCYSHRYQLHFPVYFLMILPTRLPSKNTIISAATMVAPTGVETRIEIKIPTSAQLTEITAEQMTTCLKF